MNGWGRRVTGAVADLWSYGWETGRWATLALIVVMILVAALIATTATVVPVAVYALF